MRSRSLIAVVAGLGTLLAQQPATSIEAVPQAPAVAVGVVWSLPIAAVPWLAVHAHVEGARRRVPAARFLLQITGDRACAVGVLAARDAANATALLDALLAEPALDADAFALLQARVALQQDDTQAVVPGGALAQAAAQRWQHGVAEPTSLALLEVAAAAACSAQLAVDRIGVRGCVDAGLRAAVEGRGGGALRAAAGTWPRSIEQEPWQPGRGEQVHTRVDQPFAMVAFPVPGGPATLVALEVARDRAARLLPLRGSEARSRTPLVDWSLFADDPVVRFFRRGEAPAVRLKGQPVEADAAAELAATVAELERLLAALRDRPVTEQEVSNACTRLLPELGLEEPTVPGCDPAVLGSRLRAALASWSRGVDAAAVRAVTAAAAGDLLVRTLRPQRAYWHALMPVPQADRHWRRR